MKDKASEESISADLGRSGANDQTPPASDTPPRIPEYELLRRIGGGSYGEVWLARNAVGTLRAIKVVYRKTFDTDRPYEREFSGIKKFEPISRTHESLIDVLHVGRSEEAGYFYYVMELADDAMAIPNDEGRNPKEAPRSTEERNAAATALRDSGFGIPSAFGIRNLECYVPRTLRYELQRQMRLPIDECPQLGLALTSALAHLHKHGLVHRDIKPSNIIFVNGVPKLADIGLVAGLDEARSYVGTEGYIPPEGPGKAQADLYSLGKVLYEVSTGKDRQSFPEPLTELGELDDQSQLLELNAVIHKACRVNLHERYQSAEAMRADLVLLESGQSVRRLRTIERRLALMTRAGLVVSGLLVVAAVAYLFAVSQTRRAETERRHSDHLLYAADMNLAQQALEAGNIVRATMLLEAHRPKAGREDLRGFEWHYLKNLCRSDDAHTFGGHTQTVQCVAISPDGKLLASCGDDETVRLWDFVSKTNLAVLRAHVGPVNAVAFSTNGTRLASGGADKTVKLWDVATRAVVADLTNNKAAVTALAFSSDGKRLAVGTEGVSAKVWDLATRVEVREFEGPVGSAELVALSPDGKLLATAGTSFGVKLWDLASGQPLPLLYDQAGTTWGVAFSPDSKVLVTTRSDGVVLWDVQSRGVLGKLKGHEREPGAVVFSRDGKMLATGSDDTTVRLWDFEARRLIRIFKGHSGRVFSVAFSPDGCKLVSGSVDHTVKQWDLAARQDPDVLLGHADSVLCVAFSPDDQLLASASLDGTVKLWNVTSGANLATLNGHAAAVTGVAFSANGTILVSCGVDKTIRLWNVQTREQIAVLSSGRRIGCLALSPDDRTLATGSGWVDDADVASVISFWDLQSRQLLTNVVDGVGVMRVLQFSGDGKFLVVGQARDTVTKLVDVATKHVIFSSTNLERFVALSPDGRTLASPTLAGLERIALLDTTTHRIFGSLESPSGATRYMAFSPDGRTLAVAYANAKIKLCNLASGREVATLEGHDGFCWSLAFSHDGQTLASAAGDRTIRLWRAPHDEPASADSKRPETR